MRNSVLFYKDWHDTIKEFSDDDRLKVYDAIMDYAFDGIEPEDKYIKAITALIFKGIDRNRDAYDKKCERLRQNIAKRWNKNKGNTNEYNCTQKNTDEYNCIQTIQIGSDNNNVNDKDNVNDNELAKANNIKENKENNIKENKEKQASFIEEYFAKTIAVEQLCRQLQVTPEVLRKMAEEVIVEWEAAGDKHNSYNDAHHHLTNTLRIKVRENKRNGVSNTERPERPSVHHVWSESQQKWVYVI